MGHRRSSRLSLEGDRAEGAPGGDERAVSKSHESSASSAPPVSGSRAGRPGYSSAGRKSMDSTMESKSSSGRTASVVEHKEHDIVGARPVLSRRPPAPGESSRDRRVSRPVQPRPRSSWSLNVANSWVIDLGLVHALRRISAEARLYGGVLIRHRSMSATGRSHSCIPAAAEAASQVSRSASSTDQTAGSMASDLP